MYFNYLHRTTPSSALSFSLHVCTYVLQSKGALSPKSAIVLLVAMSVHRYVHLSFSSSFSLLRRKGFIYASWCDSDSNSDVAVSCQSVSGGGEYEERNVLYWLHELVIHLPLSASKLLLSSLLVIFHRFSLPFLSSPVHTLI